MGDDIDLGRLAAEQAQAARQINEKASQVVRRVASNIVAISQREVPVDTAATKNSITAVGPGGGPLTKGDLVAEIGPSTWYAPLLEYGTVKMAPRPFMGPALDSQQQIFEDLLGEVGTVAATGSTAAGTFTATSPDTDAGPGTTYTGGTGQ